MLISKVPDEDGGRGEVPEPATNDDSHEYQTANELFEMMARSQNVQSTDGDALTPGDLVLLYKNIDIGTKLMSDANETMNKKPNQHVETVVYHDDPESEGSDVSEVYSNEDLQNIYLVNKERLDLFNIPSTANNKLCHKLGGLEIQTSNNIAYDKHFLFQDPYIKDQLKAFNLSNVKDVEGSQLPASLLDYVCCKRLEDNYNFYMDNIIRYVMTTIEQLKRISNGDYLTERAKEKWREVEHEHIDESTSLANTKVLATSTSIPLHVECKARGEKSTWDDIVHSEVDVRSLSKILEKKIVVEVPKFISGSYKLLSKCCADNLIIRCKREQLIEDTENESRVDVVFQLKRSETGHVVSNISSIMILQTAPNVKRLPDVKHADGPLSLLYNEITEENDCAESKVKIVELDTAPKEDNNLQVISNFDVDTKDVQKEENTLQTLANIDNDFNDNEILNISNTNIDCNDLQKDIDVINDDNINGNSCPPKENRRTVTFTTAAKMMDSDATDNTHTDNSEETPEYSPSETAVNLGMSIQRLALQGAVPEESLEDVTQSPRMRKKAVRIKSPYENQSFALEERKRKKLLEVRERRERKKMAMAENCKVSKNKYAKGTPIPQSSSSVTKLSITNKSFYNSIYGHNADADPKLMKNKNRKGDVYKQVPGVDLEGIDNDETASNPSRDANNKKFINRSYYLDDTETEMAAMQLKENDKDLCSGSTSGVSGEFRNNLNLLSHLIVPSDSDGNAENDETDEKEYSDKTSESLITAEIAKKESQESLAQNSPLPQTTKNMKMLNFPKDTNEPEISKDFKKIKPSIECRKSIDKIYNLMNNMEKRQEPDIKSQNKQYPNVSNRTDATGEKGSSSIQGSDSGTSLKHHISSSSPSTFSFSKTNAETSVASKTSDAQTNIISKVVISSKPHNIAPKTDVDKHKREQRGSPVSKIPENHPLKAISQLLHEFENVQKNRLKSGAEKKKRPDNTTSLKEGKANSSRQGPSKRRSRFEQHVDVEKPGRSATVKDKRARQAGATEVSKFPYQQIPIDDKFTDKNNKQKHGDVLDEVKEARGEAVRGPSKFNSRLNSLAQPKRTYVQAHSQEYQTRYGRNLITDRLQRLAAAPPPPAIDRTTGLPNYRNRMRRNNNDVVSAVSLKLPFQSNSPIERAAGARPRHYSTNNSPVRRERASTVIGPSHKKTDVFEAPEILVEKMVDVESYVKCHFGPASCNLSAIPDLSPPPQNIRAPPVPKNIDMESFPTSPWFQESAEVGSKLHRLINDIIKKSAGDLEALTESNEFSVNELAKDDEDVLLDSDFETGTTDNDVIEADKDPIDIGPVETQEHTVDLNNKNDEPTTKHQHKKGPENAGHALCNTLSLGAFSKCLKQKTSSQHLFLLQAGDTGSLVLNASIHSLQACRNSQTENILDLKVLPRLPNSSFPWGFTNIPLQVSTVNYAFPEYSSRQCVSPSLSQLLEVSSTSRKLSKISMERLIPCNKTIGTSNSKCHIKHKNPGGNQPSLEPALQTGVSVFTSPPSVMLCTNPTTDTITPVITCDTQCNSNIKITQNIESNVTIRMDGKSKKLSLFEDIKENHNDCTTISPEAVDYTTSLDILVGLLNEIKKITKSQTHITQSEAEEFKQLEIILNKADQMDNSKESITYKGLSLSKLDKLRCLESNPSVYSYYLSDAEELDKEMYDPWYDIKHPIYADKEINVNIPRKEYVNRLTDVPSIFFPMTISHSTDATSTLLAELCQTSAQSLVSYHTTSSDGPSATVIELPQVTNTGKLPTLVTNCELVEVSDQEVNVKEWKVRKPKSPNCKRNETIKKRVKKPNNQIVNHSKRTDFDSIMKMKRDVLVTIYSMLVITVFAALSFPEVLYHL